MPLCYGKINDKQVVYPKHIYGIAVKRFFIFKHIKDR